MSVVWSSGMFTIGRIAYRWKGGDGSAQHGRSVIYDWLIMCEVSCTVPSVHCWLGVRKCIRPVKIWAMRCWRGYLSGVRCKWLTYCPADATATPSSLASLKPEQFTFLVLVYPGCPGNEVVMLRVCYYNLCTWAVLTVLVARVVVWLGVLVARAVVWLGVLVARAVVWLCWLLGPWFDWAEEPWQHVLHELNPAVPQQHCATDRLLPHR